MVQLRLTTDAVERLPLPREADTARLAEALASQVAMPATLFLRGDLGVGKTTFARYFLRALGVTGPVKSPTYTLVEPYELANGMLYHFDLYRINDPWELELAGFTEMFEEPSVRLIEWPERGADWLPEADLELRFQGDNADRCVEICLRNVAAVRA